LIYNDNNPIRRLQNGIPTRPILCTDLGAISSQNVMTGAEGRRHGPSTICWPYVSSQRRQQRRAGQWTLVTRHCPLEMSRGPAPPALSHIQLIPV